MDIMQKISFIFQFEDVPGGFAPATMASPYRDTTELLNPVK